jgi:hypothetical protein
MRRATRPTSPRRRAATEWIDEPTMEAQGSSLSPVVGPSGIHRPGSLGIAAAVEHAMCPPGPEEWVKSGGPR